MSTMSMPQIGRAFTNPTVGGTTQPGLGNLNSASQLLMNSNSSPSLSGASLNSGGPSQSTSPAMALPGSSTSGGLAYSNASSLTATGLSSGIGSSSGGVSSGGVLGQPAVSHSAAFSGLGQACAAYSGSMLAGMHHRLAADYGNPYAAAAVQGSYLPLGTDASAFYSPLSSTYDLKDVQSATASAYLAYDPSSAAMAAMYPYPNGYGAADLAARRKAATRENTNTLKAWLYEHRKNPYPTKGEKIMLAIITRMTLTQVSTWFANARRRLKKDNKMTWTPRGNNEDDVDSDVDDDVDKKNDDDMFRDSRERSPIRNGSLSPITSRHDVDIISDTISPVGSNVNPRHLSCSRQDSPAHSNMSGIHANHHNNLSLPTNDTHLSAHKPGYVGNTGSVSQRTVPGGSTVADDSMHSNKPKIWSIANVVTCETETKHSDHIHMGSNASGLTSPYTSLMPRHSSLTGGMLTSMGGQGGSWSSPDSSYIRSSAYPSITHNSTSNTNGLCGGGYSGSPLTGNDGGDSVASGLNGLSGMNNSLGTSGGNGGSDLSKLDALVSHPGNSLGGTASPGHHNHASSLGGLNPASTNNNNNPQPYGFGLFGGNGPYSSISGNAINSDKCATLGPGDSSATAFRPVKR